MRKRDTQGVLHADLQCVVRPTNGLADCRHTVLPVKNALSCADPLAQMSWFASSDPLCVRNNFA